MRQRPASDARYVDSPRADRLGGEVIDRGAGRAQVAVNRHDPLGGTIRAIRGDARERRRIHAASKPSANQHLSGVTNRVGGCCVPRQDEYVGPIHNLHTCGGERPSCARCARCASWSGWSGGASGSAEASATAVAFELAPNLRCDLSNVGYHVVGGSHRAASADEYPGKDADDDAFSHASSPVVPAAPCPGQRRRYWNRNAARDLMRVAKNSGSQTLSVVSTNSSDALSDVSSQASDALQLRPTTPRVRRLAPIGSPAAVATSASSAVPSESRTSPSGSRRLNARSRDQPSLSKCSVRINAGIDNLDLFAQVALEVAVRSGNNSPAGAFADRIGISVASGAQLSQHGEQPVAALDLAPAGLASSPVGRLISFQEEPSKPSPTKCSWMFCAAGQDWMARMRGPAGSARASRASRSVHGSPRVSSPSCESRSKAT